MKLQTLDDWGFGFIICSDYGAIAFYRWQLLMWERR
jgi:hypothetical protein